MNLVLVAKRRPKGPEDQLTLSDLVHSVDVILKPIAGAFQNALDY